MASVGRARLNYDHVLAVPTLQQSQHEVLRLMRLIFLAPAFGTTLLAFHVVSFGVR